MIEINNSVNGTLLYKSPHVFHTIKDESVVAGITTSLSTGTLFSPIYTEKGPTNTVKYFSGATAASDLINTFGYPNARKLGLAYTAVYEHILAGGNVAVVSVKADDATCPAFIVNMCIQKSELVNSTGPGTGTPKRVQKTVGYVNEAWTTWDGTGAKVGAHFIEDDTANDETALKMKFDDDNDSTTPKAGTMKVLKIDSFKVWFEDAPAEKLAGIKSKDTLVNVVKNMVAEAKKAMKSPATKPTDVIRIPIVYGMYNGKGKYGNNFRAIFSSLNRTVAGRYYFESNVLDSKTGSFLPEMQQPTSLSTSRLEGQPLFIQRRYQSPYSTGEFYMNTLDNNDFNVLGEYLQKLLKDSDTGERTTLFSDEAKLNTEGTPDDAWKFSTAKAFDEEWKAAINRLNAPDDDDFHRLSLTDITALERTLGKFVVLGDDVKSGSLSEGTFQGGSEGILDRVGTLGFKWDTLFAKGTSGKVYIDDEIGEAITAGDLEAGTTGTKVLNDLFANAYMGLADYNVFNLLRNPADYIVDIGYPADIKKAMVAFSTNRDDVQVLFNSPVNTESIAQNLAWKRSFDIKGRNIYYYPASFEYVDSRTDKSYRVPLSFAVMFNVLEHYKNGFDTPIAGMENGVITGVETASGNGYGALTLKENDRLYEAGFNIVSSHREGLLYLDSQKSNYLLTETSKLQEFHNNSIVNRILKALYLSLQYEKHRLTSEEAVAKIVFKVDNQLNTEFAAKVKSLAYNGSFTSSYNEAIGLMTHEIGIQFYGTIKYHHIYLRALPNG